LTGRGVVISLFAGLLMGSFYPFVSRSMTGEHALGPYPNELLSKVTWFTPNETEAAFYTGRLERTDPTATASDLRNQGLTNLVLKLGSRGAYLATQEGQPHRISSFPVRAVDTTAAGDAFNGAFATGLALRMSPLESARFASAAAALSVTRSGAQPSMPSGAELQQLLDSNLSLR